MSTIHNKQKIWTNSNDKPDSKYEKCRNITEEIYKRINITFQIKKLEGNLSDISDFSDHIDSNELSNETDLFACDKSDCISSSTDADKPKGTCEKYININNNEETKKKASVLLKRPKKKFRKRIKKRQSKTAESDGSSDEAPLSRIVEPKVKSGAESPEHVMGVPNIVIITKDLKPKTTKPDTQDVIQRNPTPIAIVQKPKEKSGRHLSMSHVSPETKCPTQRNND